MMGNEEKILTLLETMNERMASMEDGLGSVKSDLGSVKDDLGNVKSDLRSVKDDLGNVKSDLRSVKDDLGNVKNDLGNLEKGQDILARQVSKLTEDVQEIRQSQVRMENELTEKVSALFDAREVQNDVNERIVTALERIEAKVDVLQLETAHLRRVK